MQRATKGSIPRAMRIEYEEIVSTFFSKVEKDPGGCWLWQGALNHKGYGSFHARGKSYYPHRWSYEYHKGPIPDGMVIDHLCRVRHCVNPEHLEAVTLGENTIRGHIYRYNSQQQLITWKDLYRDLYRQVYGSDVPEKEWQRDARQRRKHLISR